MKTYITATERASFDAFKGIGKDTSYIITCDSLIAAMHTFYLATNTDRYREVTLSTIKPVVNTLVFDEVAMSSDEFILVNL